MSDCAPSEPGWTVFNFLHQSGTDRTSGCAPNSLGFTFLKLLRQSGGRSLLATAGRASDGSAATGGTSTHASVCTATGSNALCHAADNANASVAPAADGAVGATSAATAAGA